MRVRTETPSRLVIEERPFLYGGLMAFFVFAMTASALGGWATMAPAVRIMIVASIAVILVLAHFHIHWVGATFDRETGRIGIVRRGLLYGRHETFALGHLTGARLDSLSPDGGTPTWRVILVFSAAMPGRLDPAERARIEALRRRGLRQLPDNEVALTAYFAGRRNAERIADAISRWMRR